MYKKNESLEQILSKERKSQLGEAELNKFPNVTELTAMTSDVQKSGTLPVD